MSQKSAGTACSPLAGEAGDRVWVVDWYCLRLQERGNMTRVFNSKSRNPQETEGVEIPPAAPFSRRRLKPVRNPVLRCSGL